MAQLIFEAARNARQESHRLRAEGAGLKLVMRARTRTTEKRAAEMEAAVERLQARRSIPFASPWSGLHWLFEDESLVRVLVPLD